MKIRGRGCSCFLRVQKQISLIYLTWPHNQTISGLYSGWCALQLRNSSTRLREAHTNLIFSLVTSVLDDYTVKPLSRMQSLSESRGGSNVT